MRINEETFSEWIQNHWDKNNLAPPELESQKALYFLADYLLEDGFYTSMPVNTKQVNVEIVAAILERHSRKYRKERKKLTEKGDKR